MLTTAEALAKFKERWLGPGYAPLFSGSKAIRDVEHNVRICENWGPRIGARSGESYFRATGPRCRDRALTINR